MRTRLLINLVFEALDMDLACRMAPEVIHHSDQGCQCRVLTFGKRCRYAGVLPSMRPVGERCDNALAEILFAAHEFELLDRHSLHMRTGARLPVFDFVEGSENPRPSHSAFGRVSPIRFEGIHAVNNSAGALAGAPSTRGTEGPLEALRGSTSLALALG